MPPDQQQEKPNTPEAEEDAGFGAAFTEFAEADASTTKEQEAADAASRSSQTADDDDGDSGPELAPIEDPAPKAEEEFKADPDADEGEPASTDQSDYDPFKDAPEPIQNAARALQKDLEEERHRAKSANGRTAALTRRLNELTNEIEVLKKAGSKPADENADGGDAGKTSLDDDPDLKALLEDYPEIGKPVQKLFSALTQQVTQANEKLAAYEGREQESAVSRETERLTEMHGDWVEVASSDDFATWVMTQPRQVQQIFRENGKAILNADDAGWMIARYKADQGMSPGGRSSQAPAEGQEAGGKPNQRQQDKRDAQLKGAAGVSGKGPGQPSGPPDDFSKAFSHYADRVT